MLLNYILGNIGKHKLNKRKSLRLALLIKYSSNVITEERKKKKKIGRPSEQDLIFLKIEKRQVAQRSVIA